MLLEPDRRAHRADAGAGAFRSSDGSSRGGRSPGGARAAAARSAGRRCPRGRCRAPATPAATPLAALPARVKALQDEIEAISKAAADGSWEPAKLYAAVLVARRHLKDVWRGFANVNEYMECLCRALTCMIKGHAAIGELTRQDAVNKCHRESRKAACEHLEQQHGGGGTGRVSARLRRSRRRGQARP